MINDNPQPCPACGRFDCNCYREYYYPHFIKHYQQRLIEPLSEGARVFVLRTLRGLNKAVRP